MSVRFLSSCLFSQSNGDHLQKPRGDTRRVFRMSLRPGENDDAVRCRRDGIKMRDRSRLGGAQRMRLHGGPDGCSDRFFSNSKPPQYFRLALFGCAAVAAHRRNQERLATTRSYCIDNAGKQVDEPSHTATAGSDGDLRIRLQRIEEPGLEQSLLSFVSNIRDVFVRKKLRHVSEWR